MSKLEGDAAFVYALETEIEASMLLDTVEETYFAFRTRVRGDKLQGLKRRAAWTVMRPFMMRQGRGNERRLQALLENHDPHLDEPGSTTPA